MKQYIDLVKTVLEEGQRKKNRTGTDTLSYFGYHYKVDLSQGFPLLTTKKIFFNSVVRELLWYLKGETHIRNLREHTKIWDAWTTENKDWEIGKMYGYQWVKWEKFVEDSKTGDSKTTLDEPKLETQKIKFPNDIRWVAKSLEYQILCEQTYKNAWDNLSEILNQSNEQSAA